MKCSPGHVLIIDLELHREHLVKRLRSVAAAIGIDHHAYGSKVDLLTLRGHPATVADLERKLLDIESGYYSLVILDPLYRALPGMDENSNADMAGVFCTLDRMADRLNAGWVNVHHSSKGNQADKAITDIGSGAGAQSRAADTHVVLRPHREPGVVVVDGVVRSFPPFQPIALRWDHPLWHVANDLSTDDLAGKRQTGKQKRADKNQDDKQKLVDWITHNGPTSISRIMGVLNCGRDRAKTIAGSLLADGVVEEDTATVANNPNTIVYQIADHS